MVQGTSSIIFNPDYRETFMRFFTLLGFIATLLIATPVYALSNRLAHHPSPYLALHANDAVAWQEWTPQTLALAKKQNKLIFLSLGYFSCQGCHKMQKEALGKGEFADFLNRHVIPVLVDRELLTALDGELQAYALRTQGLSGWPLNVILTPEGHPLQAIFYESPQQLLHSASYLQSRWAAEGKAMLADARAAVDVQLAYTPRPLRITPAVAGKFRNQFLLEVFDQADTYRGWNCTGANPIPGWAAICAPGWTPWPAPACMIRSAAAFSVTARTRNGARRIAKKCSATTASSP